MKFVCLYVFKWDHLYFRKSRIMLLPKSTWKVFPSSFSYGLKLNIVLNNIKSKQNTNNLSLYLINPKICLGILSIFSTLQDYCWMSALFLVNSNHTFFHPESKRNLWFLTFNSVNNLIFFLLLKGMLNGGPFIFKIVLSVE